MLRDNSQGRQPDSAGIERSDRGFKEQLAAKVDGFVTEFRALVDSMKTKDYHQTKQKCSECGKSYLAKQPGACSDACRKAKSRK